MGGWRQAQRLTAEHGQPKVRLELGAWFSVRMSGRRNGSDGKAESRMEPHRAADGRPAGELILREGVRGWNSARRRPGWSAKGTLRRRRNRKLNDIFCGSLRTERNTLRHLGRMLIPQVAVNPHRKRTAVLMTEPARDGGDVHSAFDAAGRKEMPQIMMRDFGDPDLFTCVSKRFSRVFESDDGSSRGIVRTLRPDFLEQRTHLGNHRY